jgi:hypothetical protein
VAASRECCNEPSMFYKIREISGFSRNQFLGVSLVGRVKVNVKLFVCLIHVCTLTIFSYISTGSHVTLLQVMEF